MHLRHPFPTKVRTSFLGRWDCDICGCNGQGFGGLELHHIFGRVSGSILNASLLCHECHENHGRNPAYRVPLLTRAILHAARHPEACDTSEDGLLTSSFRREWELAVELAFAR